MRWLGNVSLSVKLTLLILLVLGLFLISNIMLLVYSTQSFTNEVGNERIQDAITTFQSSLSAMQDQITTDINLLATDITFFQAVGRRDRDGVSAIIARTNLDQDIYAIEVVDGDGNHLLNTGQNTADDLLDQARNQGALSTLLIEEVDGQTVVNISGVAPIVSVTGNNLGAIKISRQLDQSFLNELVNDQRRVAVGLLYNGQFVAQSGQIPNITLNANALTQAENGETAITEPFTSANVPYVAAYLPLTSDQTSTPITLLIFVELSQLYSFQNTTLNNTITVFVLLMVLTIGLIYLVLYQIAIKPIDRLRMIAQEITSGQYDRRIPVSYKDELGQLALTFNEMADAIQQREDGFKAARERAERSDQVKSAFLASMSHELRTPLNAVINFTRFVIDGDTGPVNEEQSELLTEVVNSAKHLLNLINDVLDMSKIEAGSLNLFVEDDVNLNNLLNTVVATGRSLLIQKSVQMETEIEDGLTSIRGDRQRILQILLNIVSNACKFTQAGKIVIRARQHNDEIMISIKDDGPGIAPEDQPMVFEAFKQTKTGLRQGGGTGLGMPIAKSLAEAHGGRLWLESEPGKGATFHVTLPVKSENLVPVLE